MALNILISLSGGSAVGQFVVLMGGMTLGTQNCRYVSLLQHTYRLPKFSSGWWHHLNNAKALCLGSSMRFFLDFSTEHRVQGCWSVVDKWWSDRCYLMLGNREWCCKAAVELQKWLRRHCRGRWLSSTACWECCWKLLSVHSLTNLPLSLLLEVL